MDYLRLIGVLFGLLGIVATLRYYGTRKIKRLGFFFFITVNLSVLLISAFPDLLNGISNLLFEKQFPFSRFVLIFIASTFLIWFSLFWLLVKSSKSELKICLLVKKMGLDLFLERNPNFKKFKEILVVIPVFNESENLKDLLHRIPDAINGKSIDILVIDDGSIDGSAELAEKFGAYVAKNTINMGGGMALQLGFDIAQQGCAEYVVTMDADGQHLPEELPVLFEKLDEENADIVIGSRIKGKREKDSFFRYMGIFFFNAVINLITGSKITDCSNNYRVFKTKVLSKLRLVQAQYHTSEFIIEASKNGFIIAEAPITVMKRLHGKSKKGNNVKYAFNFAKTIIKTWWK